MIGAGITLSISLIGIIFTLQYWSGQMVSLQMGTMISLIMLSVAVVRYFKSKSNFYKKIISRVLIFSLACALCLLVSDLAFIKFQYRNHPNYIEAFKAYTNDPQNVELREQLHLERQRVIMPEEEFEMYLDSQ